MIMSVVNRGSIVAAQNLFCVRYGANGLCAMTLGYCMTGLPYVF